MKNLNTRPEVVLSLVTGEMVLIDGVCFKTEFLDSDIFFTTAISQVTLYNDRCDAVFAKKPCAIMPKYADYIQHIRLKEHCDTAAVSVQQMYNAIVNGKYFIG